MEREGTDSEPVELMPARLQQFNGFIHRRRGRAEIDHAVLGWLARVGLQWPWCRVLCVFEFADQPLHVIGVHRAFLGIARVAVARCTSGEERALGLVGAWIGAVRN